MTHYINPDERLTIAKIREIVEGHQTLALSDEAKRRIQKCRDYLNKKMETQKVPIYGVISAPSATSPSAKSSSASCRRTSS